MPPGQLVGRDSQLDELRAALDSAAAGRAVVVLVRGEPGIGKTQLVAELVTSFPGPVLTGHADPEAGVPPLRPWVRALAGRPEQAVLTAIGAMEALEAAGKKITVRFTARVLGFRVPGAFSLRSGEVRIDGTGATVTAVLDAASFRTRNAGRDRDVRSARFLDVERLPEILVAGRWDGPGVPLRATVTVKDVAAPLEVEIVGIDPTPLGATARARARLDRSACPVGPARGPIGRWLDVELTVVLVSG